MSLVRLVYYSALVGGWAAFAGWFLAELLFFRSGSALDRIQVAASGGIVGGAIGLGLSAVAGIANGSWKRLAMRGLPGFVGGGFGGALGAFAGDLLFSLGLPRGLGWLVMGLAIGSVEGLYERSPSKLRNGAIGGALGGLIGGSLFNVIQWGIVHGSGMSSRATAFVILGVAIGAMIGLVQVVLKQAWLTVLDGYRAGRQLILSQATTILGRGDHLSLPFIGPMNAELESEHVTIARQANGSYRVEDNRSKLGTRLNNQPLLHAAVLTDGDVIKLGGNFVRFNQRRHADGREPLVAAPAFQVRPAPPPPPIKKPPAGQAQSPAAGQAQSPAAGQAQSPAAANASASPPSPGPKPAPAAKSAPASVVKPAAPAAPRSGGIPPSPPPRKPKS